MSASPEKKAPNDSPVARMRAAYRSGDVRTARAIAKRLGAGEAEAQRLLAHTDIDGRALLIGACAVALAAIYLGSFIL